MRKKIIIILESIYNFILGFWTPILFVIMGMSFANKPKGDNYYVPPEDASSNIFFALIVLCLYLFLLLPMNITFYKNKDKENTLLVKLLPVIINILGVFSYIAFSFLGNGGKLI